MTGTLIFIAVFPFIFCLSSMMYANMANRLRHDVVRSLSSSEPHTNEVIRTKPPFHLFPFRPSLKLTDGLSYINNRTISINESFLFVFFACFLVSLLTTGCILFIISEHGSGLNPLFFSLAATVFGSLFLMKQSLLNSFLRNNIAKRAKYMNFQFLLFVFVTVAVPMALFLLRGDLFNVSFASFWINDGSQRSDIVPALNLQCPSNSSDGVLDNTFTCRARNMLFGIWLGFLIYPMVLFVFFAIDINASLRHAVSDDASLGFLSIARIKHFLAIMVSAFSVMVVVDVDLSSLSLFSGLAAAGLSVAMRDTISNFIAGIQLSWDKSLKIGDVVSIPQSISADTGSTYGIVQDIRSRYTVIEDRNTVRRLIPNSIIVSEPIEHWTHEDKSVRLSLPISIPYIKDPRKVRQAKQIMEAVCYDVPRVLAVKPPNALLVSYGESELRFSLRFWIDDAHAGIRPVISEVLISLYERLLDAGIEIPFPQQDVHIKDVPLITVENLDSHPFVSKAVQRRESI